MKILHFADLHIGVENYGRLDPATGLSTRMLDILQSFDYLVNYAINNDIDLVLFCGDAYKSRDPNPTQQREFAGRIKKLAEAGIPVFLLVGNHDLPNAERKATSTEIFATLAVNNVVVANRPDVFTINTKKGKIQVAALPWVRRGALLKQEDTRGLNMEEINSRLGRALTGIVGALAERLDPSLPSILAAHLWVGAPNRKTREGTEKSMTLGQEHALMVSNVADRRFDYVALGHIHISQVLSDSPPVVYAGSLVKLDFGDEGDEKGFYEIEINPINHDRKNRLDYRFHPVKGRRFKTIEISLTGNEISPNEFILQSLMEYSEDIKDAIVKLQLNIPVQVSRLINDTVIRAALSDAHFVIVSKNLQRENRIRLGMESTEKLTPLEALDLWAESKQKGPEQKEILLSYARRLLEEASEN